MSGYWEFPGGGIAPGETPEAALQREFREEVGIETWGWRPLIDIPWQAADEGTPLQLKVFVSDRFSGTPYGREGQAVRWQSIDTLHTLKMLPANHGMIQALRLPDRYAITGPFDRPETLFSSVQAVLRQGIRLIQWRAPWLSRSEYVRLGRHLLQIVQDGGARLMLNGDPMLLHDLPDAAGLQLPARYLPHLSQRPLPPDRLLGISIHDAEERDRALALHPDFLVLSPVLPTRSHPDRPALGWARFAALTAAATVPVYALGGLTAAHGALAQSHGGQGIAAISAWWPASDPASRSAG